MCRYQFSCNDSLLAAAQLSGSAVAFHFGENDALDLFRIIRSIHRHPHDTNGDCIAQRSLSFGFVNLKLGADI